MAVVKARLANTPTVNGRKMLSHSGICCGLGRNAEYLSKCMNGEESNICARSSVRENELMVKFFSPLAIMPSKPTQEPFSMIPHFRSGGFGVNVYVKFIFADMEFSILIDTPLGLSVSP
ncbi:hypothetical protein E2C01_023140 [Portunus trituberculatus]|uniref:Uncharacterized protein n=1 Tax=Portunus trituberculatus TaxID=210409 RepID=A0A5B7E8Y2_PORTR|nr:hypothetical protein [Portunus trituberculatus]